MALVCSAKSKVWSVLCLVGTGLALMFLVGSALGWFNAFKQKVPYKSPEKRAKAAEAGSGSGSSSSDQASHLHFC